MVKPLFYDEDLAYIHDSGFTDLARSAATTLLGALRKQKIRNGLVVDLGCGSGVLAERLTRAGYEVLGIDVSAAMLKIARRRAPRARFVRRSLFDLEIPGCVAVTAIGESLNYIFDNRGPSGLNSLFTRIHHALMPGGLLIFDLAGPGRGSKNPIVHTIGKDWAILVNKDEDRRHRILTRRMTIFRKVRKLYRRSEEVHRQRLFSPTEVMSDLRSASLSVTRLTGYAKQRFVHRIAGFLAIKP